MQFDKIKKDILGEKYSLSIAFVTPKKSKEVNKKYRSKDTPTNVLSFPFSETEGEILLCESVIKKEVKENKKTDGRNYGEWLGFLVIHGMLHLKGMNHGSIMERAEKKYDKKHLHRNRRGNNYDKSSSGRIPQKSRGGKKS